MPPEDHSRSGSTSSGRSSSLKSFFTKVAPGSRSSTISASSTHLSSKSTSSLHLNSSSTPLPGHSRFAPVRDISDEEQREAPNLGDSGWGDKAWSKVKAEQEWLSEQREEYAKRQKVFDEVQEARQKRGEGRFVSGEQRWEQELKKVKALEEKRRKEEMRKAKLEERERRRQRDLERQWALHPPTPLPWPGDSDEE
ncbi:hypothetical protein DM02DRAFT_621796 [Periconia macrospinosa]|uniref:Uncharacterized protein n=1 Tax=Periconia macrospinosa TaxID=97972 RepID=A0A2V1EFL0_9PLEO|nr:hypothetical protein DM02DRAFT_621796 [Periconia macrospinosa]